MVREASPAVIVHLAAQSSVNRSMGRPRDTILHNVRMQHHVLDASRLEAPDARVVVVGSSDEYAPPASPPKPIAEDHPLMPGTPYGHSKVLQDFAALQAHERTGVTIMRVRPFLSLGPRRSASFVGGALASQIAGIRHGKLPPVVRTGNLDLRRDFTDVRDMARALQAVALHGVPGDVYNIASGESHAIREIVDIMLDHVGIAARLESRAELMRDGEVHDVVGDATRLRAATGWLPEIPFACSVRDTLDFWIERAGALGKGNS